MDASGDENTGDSAAGSMASGSSASDAIAASAEAEAANERGSISGITGASVVKSVATFLAGLGVLFGLLYVFVTVVL